MKKTLIAAVAAFAGAAALTFTSCSNNQPKFTCFVQNVPTGGPPWWAKYTVNSETGTCDFLGTHQENGKIVTGEPLGIFLFGQGKGKLTISVQPYSLIGANAPDDGGSTVALGKFNDDPSSCTATDMSPAVGVIGDPNFAGNPASGGWVPQAGGVDGGAAECGTCSIDADCGTGGVCFRGQCTGTACAPGASGDLACSTAVVGDSCQTAAADGGAIVPDGGGYCLPITGCTAVATTSSSSGSGSGSGSTGGTTTSSGSGSGSGSGSTGGTTTSSGSGSGSGSGSTGTTGSGSGSGSTGGSSGSSGSSGTTGTPGCASDADCAAGESCDTNSGTCVPQVMAVYQFSNVKFVQAGNIPGTQMSADLVYDQSALGATGTNCHAEIHVDGVWYSTTFLYPDAGGDNIVQTLDDGGANVLGEILWHCDTDLDCASSNFALPGVTYGSDPGGWECIPFLSTNEAPETMWDGGVGPVNRCVPKTGVPVGAVQ